MIEILKKILPEHSLILLFSILLTIPIFTSSFDSHQVVKTELRQPASLPSFPNNYAALQSLPARMDAYLNDHFGYRSKLIRWNSRIKALFHLSGSPEILIGKYGWLYLAQNHNVLNQFRGLDRFSNRSIKNWLDTVKWRSDWLKKRKIPFVFVVAPNKHTIYPEFLPEYLMPVASTRLDQLSLNLKDDSDLQFVDLRSALQQAKVNKQVYYKTDSHWNQLGSFYAYLEVMEKIQNYFPEIQSRSISEFNMTVQNEDGGDLSRMLNLQNFYQESSVKMNLGDRRKLIRKSSLKINKWRGWRTTAGVNNRIKALIIGDSFFVSSKNGMEYYFCETFSETILIKDRRLIFDPELIAFFKPDIVIHGVVERRLDFLPANLLPSKPKFAVNQNYGK